MRHSDRVSPIQAALLGCALLAIHTADPVHATTRRVPSEYATIQSAIDSSPPGDTVLVAAGTYSDASTRTITGSIALGTETAIAFLRPGVALISEAGAATTILDGVDQGVRGVIVFESPDNASVPRDPGPIASDPLGPLPTRLRGFTIRMTSEAVYAEAADVAAEENVIESASANAFQFRGVVTGFVEDHTITNCQSGAFCYSTADEGLAWRRNMIRQSSSTARCFCKRAVWADNRFEYPAANLDLISAFNDPTPVITVENNSFQGWIYTQSGSHIIRGNLIEGPGSGAGIWIMGGSGLVEQNTIRNVFNGIQGGGGLDMPIRRNAIEDCQIGINGGGLVQENVILNSGNRGMQVSGIIEDNEVRGSANFGIWSNATNTVIRRNRVWDNPGHGIAALYADVDSNLVFLNGGDGIRVGVGATGPDALGPPPSAQRNLSGNTAFANASTGIHVFTSFNVRVERNLSTSNGVGIECGPDGTLFTFSCNDAVANASADFQGLCEDALGRDGNISSDPLFCNPDESDFGLQAASPCAPENSGGCGLVGAMPVSCDGPPPNSVEPTSWGRMKGHFVEPDIKR